jgi:hypothetical protein
VLRIPLRASRTHHWCLQGGKIIALPCPFRPKILLREVDVPANATGENSVRFSSLKFSGFVLHPGSGLELSRPVPNVWRSTSNEN